MHIILRSQYFRLECVQSKFKMIYFNIFYIIIYKVLPCTSEALWKSLISGFTRCIRSFTKNCVIDNFDITTRFYYVYGNNSAMILEGYPFVVLSKFKKYFSYLNVMFIKILLFN